MKPLVLVTADVKKMDGYNWHAAADTYLKALANVSDVQPVIVPSIAELSDFDSLLSKADGFLLTGSRSNVHPELFGKDPSEKYEPHDPARDATSLPLVRAAIEYGTPLLAVCRGHQELNVALGGSLSTEIQEQDNIMDHRAPVHEDQNVRFELAHTVKPTADGLLSQIVGPESVSVNSLHRQAIDRLANGLTIEALANDGTIEAASVDGAKAFALSVQWHPEYWAESEIVSRKIFEYFGMIARKEL
ncbi:MAG: gamma-glutamyl-gamma-aminobutyrate hydrolase family protein [Hyphomicrobiales bacterium]